MFKKKFRSLDKNICSDIFLKRPDKYRELESFSLTNKDLITMGSSKSYTAASFYKNSLSLQFTKFNRILEFNKSNKTIIVEAGITISELLNFTIKHNLWIPQIPGYPSISVGGCVAANVHGKSSDIHGTINKQIKSIKIFHKINGWLNLSNKENKEIFDLTIGGFGLTGTIVNVELELIDLNNLNFFTTVEKTLSIEDTIFKLNKEDKKNIFRYSWNKTTNSNKFGEGLIFKSSFANNDFAKINTELIFKKKNIHFYFPINIWNKHTIKFFQIMFYEYYKKKNSLDKFKDILFPYAGKEAYFYMFGRKGFVESQILVPYSKVDNFLDELNFIIKKNNPNTTLLSVKKINDKEHYLSFSDRGYCFTFDYVNDHKNMAFLNLVDEICIKHNLKPSIIKDSRINNITVKNCYKEFDKFRENLFNFDKKKTYKSELSERIGI